MTYAFEFNFIENKLYFYFMDSYIRSIIIWQKNFTQFIVIFIKYVLK
jgi:hypothetical protein